MSREKSMQVKVECCMKLNPRGEGKTLPPKTYNTQTQTNNRTKNVGFFSLFLTDLYYAVRVPWNHIGSPILLPSPSTRSDSFFPLCR
jgi:hypothetical protein